MSTGRHSDAGAGALESLDILANDAGGVFADRVTAERDGRTLDVRLLLHVTITNCQIVEAVDHFHQEASLGRVLALRRRVRS